MLTVALRVVNSCGLTCGYQCFGKMYESHLQEVNDLHNHMGSQPRKPWSTPSTYFCHQCGKQSFTFSTVGKLIIFHINKSFIFLDIRKKKTKDSEMNDSKHPLICSRCLLVYNPDLLLSFTKVWTLPHFHRILSVTFILQLSCISVIRHQHMLSFPCIH